MLFSFLCYDSPIGLIEIGATAEGVHSLKFVEEPQTGHSPLDSSASSQLMETQQQLAAYFAGELFRFDLPLALDGTDFQRRVWQQLLCVGYGESTSYQAIADTIGKPKAVRAVGMANGCNPLSIVVPCHRIIGSNGHLIGYGGGLWRKEWLLKHEGALLAY